MVGTSIFRGRCLCPSWTGLNMSKSGVLYREGPGAGLCSEGVRALYSRDLPVDRMTDTTENITFSQIRWRAIRWTAPFYRRKRSNHWVAWWVNWASQKEHNFLSSTDWVICDDQSLPKHINHRSRQFQLSCIFIKDHALPEFCREMLATITRQKI